MPSVNIHAVGKEFSAEKVNLSILPEKGVVFYADLPQSLRGPMVGQLEAYGALKLFVLSGEGDKWRR